MKSAGLNDAQLEQYRKEGYLVLPSFFTGEQLDRADETIREITDQALASNDYSKVMELEPQPVDGRRVARRIYNPFEQHETFRQMASEPRLLDCIETLIGPNFDLQHSKLNMKPPKVGSVVEWHQDLSYFPHTNDDLVTLLVYLDDANEENGCLRVLPRHHTHFFDHHTPDGIFAGMITEDLESGQYGQPVSLEAPAGSAILMHCIAPHSSHPNRSPHPRRTLIFEYRATDSFPIFRGENPPAMSAPPRLLRGKISRYARFGGPRPYVPVRDARVASLYEIQERTRAKMVQQGHAQSVSAGASS